jgi:hypothetical protein
VSEDNLLRILTFFLSLYGAGLSTWNFYRANVKSYDLVFLNETDRSSSENIDACFVNFQNAVFVQEIAIVVFKGTGVAVVKSDRHNSFVASNSQLKLKIPAKDIGPRVNYFCIVKGLGGKTLKRRLGNSNVNSFSRIYFGIKMRLSKI